MEHGHPKSAFGGVSGGCPVVRALEFLVRGAMVFGVFDSWSAELSGLRVLGSAQYFIIVKYRYPRGRALSCARQSNSFAPKPVFNSHLRFERLIARVMRSTTMSEFVSTLASLLVSMSFSKFLPKDFPIYRLVAARL